jgi:HD-like signal output (HDOD) protein
MKRLLFIDDDENVLNGLQRMLRPMRREWDMHFVTSGIEALHLLARTSYDVVVSDMRMPGMDGPKLLKEVQGRYPHIVRIVLSGQSDRLMIDEARGATHQYLGKPCRSDTLKARISRVCDLQGLLANEQLRCLVAGLSTVPTLPRLQHQLVHELEAGSPSMRTISAIISKDLGMTAKVLQIANATFSDRSDGLATADRAASMLGLETIVSIIRATERDPPVSVGANASFDAERLWEGSLETCHLAQAIARAEQAPEAMVDQAATAGLLHDLGTLILATHASEGYAAAVRLAREEAMPIWMAEQQLFGSTHGEVGAYLLGLWGIAEPIVDAVAYHHRPIRHAGQTFSPLTAVHLADHLQAELDATEPESVYREQLDRAYLERLGLTERLGVWQDLAAARQRG